VTYFHRARCTLVGSALVPLWLGVFAARSFSFDKAHLGEKRSVLILSKITSLHVTLLGYCDNNLGL